MIFKVNQQAAMDLVTVPVAGINYFPIIFIFLCRKVRCFLVEL